MHDPCKAMRPRRRARKWAHKCNRSPRWRGVLRKRLGLRIAMCLSVYLGTWNNIPTNNSASFGSLGIEPATWTPPPLKQCKYVYYLGRKGETDSLECSCLLLEHVNWSSRTPDIEQDDLYPSTEPCPFESLRHYCALGIGSKGYSILACDDSGGLKQSADEKNYHYLVTKLALLRKGNLLFSCPKEIYPWRTYYVLNT